MGDRLPWKCSSVPGDCGIGLLIVYSLKYDNHRVLSGNSNGSKRKEKKGSKQLVVCGDDDPWRTVILLRMS